MKIMDESMESEDCTVTVTLPPKKKKLKQARLPFQNLGSPAVSNTLSNKKRKQMASSPTICRSPKIVKITTKENAEQKTVAEARSDDNDKVTANSEDVESNSMEADDEKFADDSLVEDPPAKDKKVEGKSQDKPGAMLKFLQKLSNKDTKKDSPVVLLTRCDKIDGNSSNPKGEADEEIVMLIDERSGKSINEKSGKSIDEKSGKSIDEKSEISNDEKSGVSVSEKSEVLVVERSGISVDEKPSISREDDSSNEELAKALEDSEAEDDAASKDKSDASSDNAGANSDSDSEQVISSSDDETDEQKRSTDAENGEKSVNGKGLDKTPTSGVKAEGAMAARRKLTPKQLEKKMNSTKRREEREKLKQEKEKKREEERVIRRKERETRIREKKEKEEAEKELKKKEKEQKELKKQMEIEQKQKEKERRDKAKEEDRRKREEAKEEEKRKKEEDRLEAERKKQKAASTFVSFFVPKKTETKAAEEEKIVLTSNFMPFEVKADMRVAPICRRSLDDSEKTKFDEVCVDKAKETDDLYVAEIKKNRRKIRKSGKTWPPESKDDDIVVVEEDDDGSCNMVDQSNATVEKQRAKLLAFAENRRPPYWGTWRKRSSAVTPRRPFSKDTKWFDYEVDSDEEWEEEEPGESLRGSDDEKDEENPDDDEYDVDNEFMVPHGYLSDEEAQADEDEEDMSPETQKLKLKILGAEFEEERKTQTSRIKPRVVGPIWQGRDNSYPDNIPQKLVDFLVARQAWIRETPIVLVPPETNGTCGAAEATAKNPSGTSDERRGARKTKVPAEALPELIRLIHGNPHGLGFLIKEFMTFWNRQHRDNDRPLSKSSLHHKIRELAKRMACPEEGPMHLKACWYVSEDARKEHLGDEQLSLPNGWSYALTPRRKTLTEAPEVAEKPEREEKEKEKRNVPLITQYTMKMTQEEMKRQLAAKPAQSAPSPKPSTSKPPKRATLISVGRGEQFPKSSIISAFSKANVVGGSKIETPVVNLEAEEPVKPMVIDIADENSV